MSDPQFKIGYQKGYEDGFEEGENSVERGLPGWFGTFADMMTLYLPSLFFLQLFQLLIRLNCKKWLILPVKP